MKFLATKLRNLLAVIVIKGMASCLLIGVQYLYVQNLTYIYYQKNCSFHHSRCMVRFLIITQSLFYYYL